MSAARGRNPDQESVIASDEIRADISLAAARIEHQASSLMPADYRSKLTGSELDDLIGFLSQNAGSNKGDSDDDQE